MICKWTQEISNTLKAIEQSFPFWNIDKNACTSPQYDVQCIDLKLIID